MNIFFKITSIFLTVLFLFNTLYGSLTYAYYYLDKSDFITQFCVNKDKPEMKCNGKCHLKKVAKETNNNTPLPSKKITFKETTLFIEKEYSYQLLTFSQIQKNISFYQENYFYLDAYAFFHPPRIS